LEKEALAVKKESRLGKIQFMKNILVVILKFNIMILSNSILMIFPKYLFLHQNKKKILQKELKKVMKMQKESLSNLISDLLLVLPKDFLDLDLVFLILFKNEILDLSKL
jgi:hypothetical protein